MQQGQPPIPTFVWYLMWILLLIWTMSQHWIFPPIAFALGAVILYNTQHGGPLQNVVQRVQVWQNVDLRRAQQLAFGAGMVLVLIGVPATALVNRQTEARAAQARALENQELERRQAVAQAEERAQEAQAAAAQAETERLKAEEAASDTKAREDAKLKREQDREQRARDAAARAQKDAAQRQKDQQAQAQQDIVDAAAKAQAAETEEATRRVAEGPYTQDQAEDMCKDGVAAQFGVNRMDVHQQGGYVQIMESRPRNMAWGTGRLWVWRPTFKLAGMNTPFDVLCRVHASGQVDIGDQ